MKKIINTNNAPAPIGPYSQAVAFGDLIFVSGQIPSKVDGTIVSGDIKAETNHQAPGLDIHEMGGARMGLDPKTSILNKWNQVHSCPNVFVTDGASMTSTSCQNPSLTYMALTARAVDHAVSESKKGNI